jgi:hypothetical protein
MSFFLGPLPRYLLARKRREAVRRGQYLREHGPLHTIPPPRQPVEWNTQSPHAIFGVPSGWATVDRATFAAEAVNDPTALRLEAAVRRTYQTGFPSTISLGVKDDRELGRAFRRGEITPRELAEGRARQNGSQLGQVERWSVGGEAGIIVPLYSNGLKGPYHVTEVWCGHHNKVFTIGFEGPTLYRGEQIEWWGFLTVIGTLRWR